MKKISIFIAVLVLFVSVSPAVAKNQQTVYYEGPQGGVTTALGLDTSSEVTDSLRSADVIIINGSLSNGKEIHSLVENGVGLVLILGQAETMPIKELQDLLGTNLSIEQLTDAVSLEPVKDSDPDLLKQIVWTSAPQVRERSKLIDIPGSQTIIQAYETKEPILSKLNIGKGQVFIFSAYLGSENNQIQEWAYFNYMVYHLAHRAGGEVPATFANYEGSPVPHRKDQLVIFLVLGVMVLISAAAFFVVRKYSKRHPEILDRIVIDKSQYVKREAKTEWEDIGFHRPLGGFFMAMFLGLLLFVPLIIYQNLLLPAYILPSAQALGIWARVTQAFQFLWLLFDMGTSVAFIKYMSEYRVHDPKEGIKFGQVFIWWQALSGAVQVALVIALSTTVLPKTVYAIYAWSIIIHTLIQIPGFYQIMRHALTGLQRFDFAQILDLGLALVFPVFVQPLIVIGFVAWGRAHPVFGTAMGGVIGLGVAAYVTELLTFLLGLFLYRSLGLNSGVYFFAHFDWKTVGKSFAFGSFDMLGSIFWAIGQFVEVFITAMFLVNSAEVWGNWSLAQNFVFGFQVLQTLYSNIMPSISEAISHGKRILSQYYSAISYKWGGLISGFIGAVLLAVADRFILGSTGPEFARAAIYATPLMIWGAVQYPSWVGDNVQRGANKPWILAALIGMEQTIRIGLALLLLRKYQITGLIIAYFVGLMTKNIVAYFVNDKLCFKQKFYFWQSLAAPLLAGGVHYLLLRYVTGLIWQKDQVTSILILLVGLLPSYPIYAFVYSFFGGWDDDDLKEMKKAVEMSSFMRPFAWLWWKACVLGSRISPLHGKFPITIRGQAEEEARLLTSQKVSLVSD